MRLDRALCERFGLSRAAVKRLIEQGSVRLSGRPMHKGMLLSAGMKLAVELQSDADGALPDPSLPLVVLYEDDALVIIDKPPGMPSHPLRAGELGCAANLLLARYPEMRGVGYGPREPGLVHRLDNDTSGLLLAARTQPAFEALRAALGAGQVEKTYLALVSRAVAVPRTVSLALQPSQKNSRRVEVNSDPHARPTRTEFVRCARRGASYLVEAQASHAYRHQIRAHLAAIDAPIVGDVLYGGEPLPGVSRHLLHAARARFQHPQHERVIEIECPLPSDWPT
jgi:23S rRNA pseudouridine1911/1915/1917 synthase